MFCLVLFIVFVIFKADAIHSDTEMTVVRLRYNYDNNENFTVWIDEPMKIIIENACARYIWCFNKYVKPGGPSFELFVPETEFTNNIVNVLTITKVTAEMSTRWGCTVLQEYHGPSTPYNYKNRNYTAKDLHFHLNVKGVRQVILTANNQTVEYDVKTNMLVEYYGVANYTFKNGEDVEISCKKSPDHAQPSDTLRLEYFNAEGILLFQSKSGAKLKKFRSVLNFRNDKYYLDCICDSIRNGALRENRYRTIFYMKKDAEEHAIKLSINGQKLATFLNKDTSTDEYIFRYIDGEILNITCQEIHSYPIGTIHFIFDRNLNYQEDLRDKKMGKISLKLLASNLTNKTLSCGITNTEIQQPIARLLFSSDIPDHGIRVRGLPRNNVLYQYTNDLDELTIEYQYSVNDTLSLTCVANSGVLSPGHRLGLRNSPLFQWKFEGVIIDSPAKWSQVFPNTKTSDKITKILDANHNGTKIICTYFPKGTSDCNFNKTAEVILRLKSEHSVFEREKNSEGIYTDKDSYLTMIVSTAISFGVVVAMTTMLCVICWHKRTERLNLIEDTYDNFSNLNDSPIPAFPSQWESNEDDSHYTNIDEEVMQENYNYSTDEDSLNTMLYKRASSNSENHYTEIDHYFKPKPGRLIANWNSVPMNDNNTSALKGRASYNSNDAIYNNDRFMRNNLSTNKDNKNNSNLESKGKNKSVTFRQTSNEWKPASKYNEGNSRQECRNNNQRLKQNYDGNVETWGHSKKPYNENIKNKECVNPSDLDYTVPYGDLGISCKKGFNR